MTYAFRALAEAPRLADGNKVGGYAAVFNETVEIVEGGRRFRERVARGAFKSSVTGGSDVFALVNHDRNLVLGRTAAGTLQVAEDRRGLAWEAELPETSYASDLRALIARGDVSQCSFGWVLPSTVESWKGDVRTIEHVDLVDVSAVSVRPGYPSTNVELRALDSVVSLELYRRRLRLHGHRIRRNPGAYSC